MEFSKRDSLAEGFQFMGFDLVLPLFVEVGRSQNDAERVASEFLANLLSQPLVDALRSDDPIADAMRDGHKLLKELLDLSTTAYHNIASMGKVLSIFQALAVLYESARSPKEKLPHAPSVLRSAVASVTSLPRSDSQLALAIHHGAVGQHLLRDAEVHITSSAEDTIASDTFKQALRRFSAIGSISIEDDSENLANAQELNAILQLVVSATSQWGQSSKEDNAAIAGTFFVDFAELLEAEVGTMLEMIALGWATCAVCCPKCPWRRNHRPPRPPRPPRPRLPALRTCRRQARRALRAPPNRRRNQKWRRARPPHRPPSIASSTSSASTSPCR